MNPPPTPTKPGNRIYLAGPMVFLPDPEATFHVMKTICRRHGLEGVSPLDNQIGLEGLPLGESLLERIVKADIDLMRTLDGGLFCLDGFRRSPEMDAGTAFEVGYMRALGKPIAGWTSDPRDYPTKVRTYFETNFGLTLAIATPGLKGGTSGITRDPDGMLVHSEGCMQNAMIEFGIKTSGGQILAHADWELAFDRAAATLSGQLSR